MSEPREKRCPDCGRKLGNAIGAHRGCEATFETKCGRCGAIVTLPLDPDIHPYIQSN